MKVSRLWEKIDMNKAGNPGWYGPMTNLVGVGKSYVNQATGAQASGNHIMPFPRLHFYAMGSALATAIPAGHFSLTSKIFLS